MVAGHPVAGHSGSPVRVIFKKIYLQTKNKRVNSHEFENPNLVLVFEGFGISFGI